MLILVEVAHLSFPAPPQIWKDRRLHDRQPSPSRVKEYYCNQRKRRGPSNDRLSGFQRLASIQLANIEGYQYQEPDRRREGEHQYSYREQMEHDQSLHNESDELSPAGDCELAKVARALAGSGSVSFPIMLCFYSGSMPPFSTPMPRDPLPVKGVPFDEQFPDVLADVLLSNAAVHDGAIMLGRSNPSEGYKVAGWSHRLHPPAVNTTVLNKGSAFNSCAAMSCVPGVDALYLISRDGIFAFCGGAACKINT